MKHFNKTNHRNWKERVVMILIETTSLIDSLVYLGSFTFYKSDFRVTILFNTTLDEWIEE